MKRWEVFSQQLSRYLLAGKWLVRSRNHSRATLRALLACSYSNPEVFVQDLMVCLYQHGTKRPSVTHRA